MRLPAPLRVVLVLIPFASLGCSSEGNTTHEQCLTACDSSLTFALATPLAGDRIEIAVGLPDGSVEQIDCQRGSASFACIPVQSRVEVNFDANGALASLHLSSPWTGDYAVQVAVDGVPAAAGAFSYQPPPGAPYTGPCPGIPCAGAQTFTLTGTN
jgi:hypothetical protein